MTFRKGPARKRLASLSTSALEGMLRGVEKESLRVAPDGTLSRGPHPAALGSALTHPAITTDFSEAQLELITGVHRTADDCRAELNWLHRGTVRAIGDELLWAASMPGDLPAEHEIPIAAYGRSNPGLAKTVYRVGLGHRYGRRMQTICGVHYNWSLPGLGSDDYLALIRNFRRAAFLPIYLFGASPAVRAGFVDGSSHGLQPMAAQTLWQPYATSLRMSRLGYRNDAQAGLAVSFNSLGGYADSLREALMRPHAPYQAIGLRDADGGYRQLSTALLQLENEFYGTVRPKRRTAPNERPLHALLARGIEYVEVRCLDLDPFDPLGVPATTMRFLDTLLLHCLLADSPPDAPAESAALARNQERVAARGREPGLRLECGLSEVGLAQWGRHLLDECAQLASALDALHGGDDYRAAIECAREALANPARLPSARVAESVGRDFGGSYAAFALARSRIAAARLRGAAWTRDDAQRFQALASQSQRAQQAVEAADDRPFDDYRRQLVALDTPPNTVAREAVG